jgi:glycerophosphoryl diester phosphodiesterase
MLIYGHRGAQGEAPESTIAGFRHAIDIGLQAVEFDVQLTADQRLVVIHDRTVDRTTNGSGPVSSFTLEKIRKLDARAQFPDWPDRCQVPTLDEVLNVVGVLPSLLVEIKRDTPERLDFVVPALLCHIRERDLADRVSISSFDPYALELVQRFAPDIPRTMNGAWREPGLGDRAVAAGCTQVDFDYQQTGSGHVEWARANGMSIVGWPCNNATDLETLLGFGVDAVGSDHPTLIQELLTAIVS